MAWQDIVGAQIAAAAGARALRDAARGRPLRSVIEEPDSTADVPGFDDMPPHELPSRGQRPRALPPRGSRQRGSTVEDFCHDFADYLNTALGTDLEAREVYRAMTRLASEGWDIDVKRSGER